MPAHAGPPTVIIVGATGLIGGSLVRRFAGPYQVMAMDLRPPDDLPAGADFAEIDVTSDERVQEAMDRAREAGPVASVLHLAAYYDFSGEPSDKYEKITVEGTRRVIRAARELPAEQFVFSSSMLVHRPTEPGRPFDEDQPLEAKWDYPKSKVAAEDVIRSERGTMPAVVLRIAGIYTDQCDSIPLSRQIQRIAERRVTSGVYPGETGRGQAFVHLDDVVEAFWRTVERRRDLPSGFLPLLIGEPETPGYGLLQREFAARLHQSDDWKTRRIPKFLAKSGAWVQDKTPGAEDPFIKPWMIDLADDHYEMDVSRARQLLGWSPEHRLLDSLGDMIEALREDPRGWYERHGLENPSRAVSAVRRT